MPNGMYGGYQPGGALDAMFDSIQNMVYMMNNAMGTSLERLLRLRPEQFTSYDFLKIAETLDMKQAQTEVNSFVSAVLTASKAVSIFSERLGRAIESLVGGRTTVVERGMRSAFPYVGGVWGEPLEVPTTRRMPLYHYLFSPFQHLLELRRGFREGLTGTRQIETAQAFYYEPFYQVGRYLLAAARRFEDASRLFPSDIRNLRYVMARTHEGVVQQANAFTTLLRDMFAGARVVQELRKQRALYVPAAAPEGLFTEGGLRWPSLARLSSNIVARRMDDLIAEVSRSYDEVVYPQLAEMSARTSTLLGEYLQSFKQVSGVPVLSFRARGLLGVAGQTMFKTVESLRFEDLGYQVQIAQGALATLSQLLMFPRLQRTAALSLRNTAFAYLSQLMSEVYRSVPVLPAQLRPVEATIREHGFYQEQTRMYRQLQEEYNRLAQQRPERIVELGQIPAQLEQREEELRRLEEERTRVESELQRARQYPTEYFPGGRRTQEQRIRELEQQLQNLTRSIEQTVGEIENLRGRWRTLQEEETRYRVLEQRELPETRAQLRHYEARVAQNLRQAMVNLEQVVGKGILPPQVEQTLASALPLIRTALSKAEVIGGERQPTIAERLAPVIGEMRTAFTSFAAMNIQNFQVALMFGLSHAIFDAMTRIPMEATYRSVQPLFGALGTITGAVPFYHEFAQFAYQAPRIMADLEARMASMQALLGTRFYAEQAIERAIEIARVQPIQFPQAMEVLTAMAVYPSTRMYATSEEFQQRIFTAVQLLSMLAPEQGIGGALFAIREMLGGQFRSLQLRFNISPDILAAYAGVSLAQFKAAPGAEKIEILAKALEAMFGGQEVLFRRGAQFEIQLRNIGDTLVSAIVLPLVNQVQPAFSQIVRGLLQVRRPERPGGIVEALMQTEFMQLLPQPQAERLLGVAAERTLAGLTYQQRELIARVVQREPGQLTAQDLMRFMRAREIPAPREGETIRDLKSAIDSLKQTIAAQLPTQAQTIAVQTYGTTAGMLALLTTTFNKLLEPLVSGLGIHRGISELIRQFAGPMLQRAVAFRAAIEAAPQEERRQLAEEFVRGFVEDLRRAIRTASRAFATPAIRGLLAPITELMREAVTAAFRPIAEVAMLQTIKTAIQLPGMLVGGTIASLVAGARTGEASVNLPGLIGIGGWISLSAFRVIGIGRALSGFVGAALAQFALESGLRDLQSLTYLAASIPMIAHGFGLLSKGFMSNVMSFLGMIPRALLEGPTGMGALAQMLRLPTGLGRAMWYASIAGLSGAGMYMGYRAAVGAEHWAPRALGAAAVALPAIGLLLPGVNMALVAFGSALAGVLANVLAAHFRRQEVERARERYMPQPEELYQRNVRIFEQPVEERAAYVRRLITQLRTAYPILTYPEGETPRVFWQRYETATVGYATAPFRLARDIGEQLGLAVRIASEAVGIPREFLQDWVRGRYQERAAQPFVQLFAPYFLERLQMAPEERRPVVEQQMFRAVQQLDAQLASTTERYMTRMRGLWAQRMAGTITPEEFATRAREYREEYRREVRREYLESPLMAFIPAERREAVAEQAAEKQMQAAERQLQAAQIQYESSHRRFRETIFPAVAREAVVTGLYRAGRYEAPLTIPPEYMAPEAQTQLRERIIQIAQNITAMSQTAQRAVFGVGQTLVMAGVLDPRRFIALQRMLGEQYYQMIQTGTFDVYRFAANPQQFMQVIQALIMAGRWTPETRQRIEQLYFQQVGQNMADFQKQLQVFREQGLQLDLTPGRKFMQALDQLANQTSSAGQELVSAIRDVAHKLVNIFIYRRPEEEQREQRPPQQQPPAAQQPQPQQRAEMRAPEVRREEVTQQRREVVTREERTQRTTEIDRLIQEVEQEVGGTPTPPPVQRTEEVQPKETQVEVTVRQQPEQPEVGRIGRIPIEIETRQVEAEQPKQPPAPTPEVTGVGMLGVTLQQTLQHPPEVPPAQEIRAGHLNITAGTAQIQGQVQAEAQVNIPQREIQQSPLTQVPQILNNLLTPLQNIPLQLTPQEVAQQAFQLPEITPQYTPAPLQTPELGIGVEPGAVRPEAPPPPPSAIQLDKDSYIVRRETEKGDILDLYEGGIKKGYVLIVDKMVANNSRIE